MYGLHVWALLFMPLVYDSPRTNHILRLEGIMTTLTSAKPTLAATLWPAGAYSAIRWIVLMLAGVVFIALAARISVGYPVPFTMQTFAVLVLGMAYGSRLGAATLALYMAAGLAGVPVFATSGALGPTLGYILGFIFAAGLVGWLAEQGWDRTVMRSAAAMLIGNILIYVPGLIVLAWFVGTDKVLEYGLFPFLLGDALKLVLAALALPGAWYLVGRREA
jgi:biotin transport system substrate-specific component